MTHFSTLIISAIEDLKVECPEMSFGELLYTIFRKENLKTKPEGISTSWLLSIKDEDIYNSIEKTIRNEKMLKEEEE